METKYALDEEKIMEILEPLWPTTNVTNREECTEILLCFLNSEYKIAKESYEQGLRGEPFDYRRPLKEVTA